MLQSGFMSVAQVQTKDEFQREVISFAKHLGFSTVTATTGQEHLNGSTEFVAVDNTPMAFLAAYDDQVNRQRDPVAQHCKRHSLPIIWGQDTYTKCGLGEKWEEQAKFGYQTGIALALHLPEGRHFYIGVDRDQPLPQDTSELTRMVAHLQLFAVYAQEAAQRVLLPDGSTAQDIPTLTPREVEALRWTMDSKTAWEVGKILGISERTAVLHINNAMHKLGCVNKHQAVLKAIRFGLLR
jgi:DNA-binding CsgD family transcriptional regulator